VIKKSREDIALFGYICRKGKIKDIHAKLKTHPIVAYLSSIQGGLEVLGGGKGANNCPEAW
jgi:hypothetical protein